MALKIKELHTKKWIAKPDNIKNLNIKSLESKTKEK